MLPESPIQKIALPQFMEHFGDLWSNLAELTPYEYGLIIGTYYIVFVGHYDREQTASLRNTARVAFKVMDNGILADFDAVASAFIVNSDRVPRQINRIWDRLQQIRALQSVDQKMDAYLRFYQMLYEGLVPALLAPVIVGMGVTAGSNPAHFRLDADGRVKLSALSQIQYYSQFPSKQLSIGLHPHLRNASAHHRYRFLDGARMEFWDVDPRTGQRSWGPETWPLDKLEDLCNDLWRNCLGLTYAFALFSLNHRRVFEQAGTLSQVHPASDPVRADELRATTTYLARIRGFDVKSFTFDAGNLSMQLLTHHRGVDQESELLMSGPKRVTKYSVAMRHDDLPLIEQLVGLLQEIEHELGDPFAFHVAVHSPDGTDYGFLSGETRAIPEKRIPLTELRPRFKGDTIADVKIPVLVEGYPREMA
jgi:hypothetical protein